MIAFSHHVARVRSVCELSTHELFRGKSRFSKVASAKCMATDYCLGLAMDGKAKTRWGRVEELDAMVSERVKARLPLINMRAKARRGWVDDGTWPPNDNTLC